MDRSFVLFCFVGDFGGNVMISSVSLCIYRSQHLKVKVTCGHFLISPFTFSLFSLFLDLGSLLI